MITEKENHCINLHWMSSTRKWLTASESTKVMILLSSVAIPKEFVLTLFTRIVGLVTRPLSRHLCTTVCEGRVVLGRPYGCD